MLTSDLHRSLRDSAFRSIETLNEIMAEYPEAISFAPGAPALDPELVGSFSHYMATFMEFLQTQRGLTVAQARGMIVNYGPSIGVINDLIAEALSTSHRRPVEPEQVVVTSGAQEGMLLCLRALFGTSADVLGVVVPTFMGIRGAASLLDVEAVAIPENFDGPDLSALRSVQKGLLATGKRLRAIYVSPDFSNPSGSFMSLGARVDLLQLAQELDFYVVEDTAYSFTARGNRVPSLQELDATDRVISIGTFSKIGFPASRVGYVVAGQVVIDDDGQQLTLAELLARLKGMTTVNTAGPSQAIIGGLLLDRGSIRALEEGLAAAYERKMDTALRALRRYSREAGLTPDQLSWNEPTGGFFVVLTLSRPFGRQELRRCAVEHRVLWMPMREFYFDGGGDNSIRLSISYLEEGEIREGIRRLVEYLATMLTQVSAHV